jgi:hypothetical protein
MSVVREMRERQVMTASPERSGLAGTLLIGFAAFAIGALAIVGWKIWPDPKPTAPAVALGNQPIASPPVAAANQPALKFSGKRLGEAEHAPLLATCIKGDNFEGFGGGSPQAVYGMLTMMGTATRVGSLIGAEMGDRAQLTDYWRLIADCVYQQNSWNLCDPDNRALAIESGGAFIRGAAVVAANPPQGRAGPIVLRNNAQSRERVLDGLRTRVRNGYLIANDFGPVQPPEIKALLAETKTTANGCTKP